MPPKFSFGLTLPLFMIPMDSHGLAFDASLLNTGALDHLAALVFESNEENDLRTQGSHFSFGLLARQLFENPPPPLMTHGGGAEYPVPMPNHGAGYDGQVY
jgi:hypothetical protein